MASRSLNFYIGMCNNLRRRVLEHKRGEVEDFTKRYNIRDFTRMMEEWKD